MPLDSKLRSAAENAAGEDNNDPEMPVWNPSEQEMERPPVAGDWARWDQELMNPQPKEPDPPVQTQTERGKEDVLTQKLLDALAESNSLNQKLLAALSQAEDSSAAVKQMLARMGVLEPTVRQLAAQTKELEPEVRQLAAQAGETGPAMKTLLAKAGELEPAVKELGEKQSKNDRQLAQYIRENANFQIQVRQGMQSELEELRKAQKGEQFTPILKDLADLYSVFYPLLLGNSVEDQQSRNIRAMFEQLEDLFADYGAEPCVSRPGDERRTRVSKIIKKIPTGEKEKHNTVVRSIRPGVVREKMVLSEEYIDVYIYDEKLALAPAQSAAAEDETEKPAEAAAAEPAEEKPAEAAAAEPAEEKPAEAAAAEPAEEKPVEAAEAEPAEEKPAEAAEAETTEEKPAEAAEPETGEEKPAEAEPENDGTAPDSQE